MAERKNGKVFFYTNDVCKKESLYRLTSASGHY